MTYVLINHNLDLFISKWFEQESRKTKFTENIKDALVFKDMPSANGFKKHYFLTSFEMMQVQLPATDTKRKIPKMEVFEL